MLAGFVYLPVLYLLYNTRLRILFITMCTCWVYTLGVFSMSSLCADIWFSGKLLYCVIIETIIYGVSFVPFYRYMRGKSAFVLENLHLFNENIDKYILLSNCVNFIILALLQGLLLEGEGNLTKLCILMLLMFSIFISNFTLYRIVQDSIKVRNLEKAVLLDSLTGIGNRVGLLECLTELLKSGKTFSVVFMDLDHFKNVNDQYGHMAGDEYLRHFVRISSEWLGDSGRMYRFGGDEFVVLYNGIIPESIIEALRECRDWENNAPCPFNQVSIGVLYCDSTGEDSAEEIISKVDRIMYEQKIAKKSL